MLYSIKNREDLENLEELASLQNQVKLSDYKISLVNKTFMKTWKRSLNLLLNHLKILLKI